MTIQRTYNWVTVKLPECICVLCYQSRYDAQDTGGSLAALKRPAPFHNGELAQASDTISSVLRQAASGGPKGQKLSFIGYQGRPFLVWAKNVGKPSGKRLTGPEDSLEHVASVMRLKTSGHESSTALRWALTPDRSLVCLPSERPNCYSTALWQATEATAWHTPRLEIATRQVQQILDQAVSVTPPDKKLVLISYNYKLLLAWTDKVVPVGPSSTFSEVVAALHLDLRTRAL